MMMMMMMVVMMMVMMLVIMMIMMIMKTGKLLSNAQVDVQLGVQLQLDQYNVSCFEAFSFRSKCTKMVKTMMTAVITTLYYCSTDNADD